MRSAIQYALTLVLFISLWSACTPNKQSQQTANPQDSTLITPLQPPFMPDYLRGNAAAQQDYLAQNFWRNLDFTDTIRSLNRDFMEQNFADFIFSLQLCSTPQAAQTAVANLCGAAQEHLKAYKLIVELAQKYLYEPNSPQYNEAIYLLFLDRFIADSVLSEAEKIRPQAQKEALLKNRQGTPATDFSFQTLDGGTAKLSGLKGLPVAIIFYDPECDVCQGVLQDFSSDAVIADAVQNGLLTLLTLCVEGDPADWRAKAQTLPREWTHGYNAADFSSEQLYSLRSIPSIYLLDAQGVVICKDGADLQAVRPDLEHLLGLTPSEAPLPHP